MRLRVHLVGGYWRVASWIVDSIIYAISEITPSAFLLKPRRELAPLLRCHPPDTAFHRPIPRIGGPLGLGAGVARPSQRERIHSGGTLVANFMSHCLINHVRVVLCILRRDGGRDPRSTPAIIIRPNGTGCISWRMGPVGGLLRPRIPFVPLQADCRSNERMDRRTPERRCDVKFGDCSHLVSRHERPPYTILLMWLPLLRKFA